MEIQLRVVKENGQNLTEHDREKIQPTHDFFDALFSSVDVLINEVGVGDIGTFHPQTALLHNLLDYDEQYQYDTMKFSNVWSKDYQYPAAIPQSRHMCIEKSKVLQLYGRLNHNVFTSKRFLPPKTSVQIKMRRNSDEYCLIRTEGAQDKYKIIIDSCKVHVRRILFYDSVMEQLENYPKKHLAKFPYTQTTMNRFQIPIGSSMNRSLNCGWGVMPKRAFFTICETESIDGNKWENNPMIFPAAQYGVNHLQFYSEEDEPILQKPYKPDFANKNTNRSYNQFLQVATNGFRTSYNPGLTAEDFIGQYGVFGLDKMPDMSQMSFQVGFDKPTTRTLYGLLFIQRDAYFTIDGFGGVKNTH